MTLFTLVGAIDSAVRVGQDAVDDSVARNGFVEARQMLEQHVLPLAMQYRMLDRATAILGQYAVVLAYCQDFPAAEKEIQELEAYAGGFSDEQRKVINDQRALIADLRGGKAPAARQ